jgi:hypothetical protein
LENRPEVAIAYLFYVNPSGTAIPDWLETTFLSLFSDKATSKLTPILKTHPTCRSDSRIASPEPLGQDLGIFQAQPRNNRPLAKKGLIPPTPLKKGGFKEFGKRSNNVEAIRESPVQNPPRRHLSIKPQNNVEVIRESPVQNL